MFVLFVTTWLFTLLQLTTQQTATSIADLQVQIQSNRNFSQSLLERINSIREGLLLNPDPGWYNGLNGYQYRPTEFRRNWNDSRKLCQEMDGDLAVYGARDIIRKAAASYFSVSREFLWIGLTDIEEEGVFKWLDGTNSTNENTPWFHDSPNGGIREGCGEIYSGFLSYGINDADCQIEQRALCEKPLCANNCIL